jgi:DNA repair protein RadA/Sms
MAGGVKISEPAVDLAVCCAITSSLLDKVADNQTVVIGEVGLGGEIRSVGHIEKRIQEAEKLGFKRIIIPQNSAKNIKKAGSVKIEAVESLSEAINKSLK